MEIREASIMVKIESFENLLEPGKPPPWSAPPPPSLKKFRTEVVLPPGKEKAERETEDGKAPRKPLLYEGIDLSISNNPGVAPSGGSITIIGNPMALQKHLKVGNKLKITIRDTLGERVIDNLRIVRFTTASGITQMPLGFANMQAFRVDFEDFRFVLKFGGVFGEFNIIENFDREGRVIFRNNSLKSNKHPWQYGELIEMILKSWFTAWDGGGRNAKCKVSFIPALTTVLAGAEELVAASFDREKARRMLGSYPFNKRWRSAPRDSCLAELLKECGHQLTVNDKGEFLIFPTEPVSIKLGGEPIGDFRQEGKMKGLIPERVYVVGAQRKFLVKLEPDWNEWMIKIMETMRELQKAEAAGAGREGPGDVWGKVLAMEKWLENQIGARVDKKGKVTPGPLETLADKCPIEPVCLDLSGRWRNLWELLERWKVSAIGFCKWVSHKYSKEVLINNISTSIEDLYDEERKAYWDYLGIGVKVDLQKSKADLLHQYGLKAYRIKEPIKVVYNWDEEQEEIRRFFAPNAPSGETELNHDQFLPLCEFLSPVWIYDTAKKGNPSVGIVMEPKVAGEIEKSVRQRQRMICWTLEWSKMVTGQLNWGNLALLELEKLTELLSMRTTVVEQHRPLQLLKMEVPKTIETKDGVFIFEKEPSLILATPGLSEHACFMPFAQPMGALIAFESKDERLGILNNFVCEVKKPSGIKGKSVEGLVKVVQIDELVEYVRDGKSANRKELKRLCEKYADLIWEAAAEDEARSFQAEYAYGTISILPIGGVASVATQISPSSLSTRAEFNSGKNAGSDLLPMKRKINQLKAREPHDLRLFTLDAAMEAGQRRFENADRVVTAAEKTREERTLYNAQHTGLIGVYDAGEEEDVILCEAELFDPAWHTHRIDKIGPLLARPPSKEALPLYGEAPCIDLFGHIWFKPGECLCGRNHTHKIGGHWYPYVRLPTTLLKTPEIEVQRSVTVGSVYPPVVSTGNPQIQALKFERGKDNVKAAASVNVIERLRKDDGTYSPLGLLFEYTYSSEPGNEMGDTAVFRFDIWNFHDEGDIESVPATMDVYLPVPVGANKKRKRALIVFPQTVVPWDYVVADFSRPVSELDTYNGDIDVIAVKAVHCMDEMNKVSIEGGLG